MHADELRNEHGVRAIVVLLHEGGTPTPFAGIDNCNVSAAITDIVDRTTDAVDLFVTGHRHQPYVCTAGNASIVMTNTFTGPPGPGRSEGPVVRPGGRGAGGAPALELADVHVQRATATAISDTPCAGAPNPVSNVAINGVPLDRAASYRVTTNSFPADGGDGFQSLRAGTNRTSLPDFDVDSLVRYLEPTLTGAPIGPPPNNRITVVL